MICGYEGRSLRRFPAWLRSVPSEITERVVYLEIERLTGGLILFWSKRWSGSSTYSVRFALGSQEAADRLRRRGVLHIGDVELPIEEDRRPANSRGEVIRFWASSMSWHVMLEENNAERWHKVERPDMILVDFYFSRGHEVLRWVYPDSENNSLHYKMELSLKYVTENIRFFHSPADKSAFLMAIPMMRRPAASFFRFDPPNPPQGEPKPNPFIHLPAAPFEVEGTQALIGQMLASDGVIDRRLSASTYFDGYDQSPLQHCDMVVFKFHNRTREFHDSALFANLRKLRLTKAKRGWMGSDSENDRFPKIQSIGKPILYVPPEHKMLPYDVKWRGLSLMTNDVISVRAYVDYLLPKLVEHLRDPSISLSLLCAAIDVFSGKSLKRIHRNYNEKIYGSNVLVPFADALNKARQYSLTAQTSEDLGEDQSSKHFMVPRLMVSPSKLYFVGPDVELSNRMLRKFPEQSRSGHFVRVTFVDEELTRLSLSERRYGASLDSQYVAMHIQKCMGSGIEFFGEKLEFIIYSKSGLREMSCWFLRQTPDLSAQKVREWMGDMSTFRVPAKASARMGMNLTQTTKAGSNLQPHEYAIIPDVKSADGRYNFTDGCGIISPEFADTVSITLGYPMETSAFQVRFMGCKGMLVRFPTSNPSVKFEVRESMRKFETHASPLEIVQQSTFRSAYLNREIILLLSALGVSDDVFVKLQQQYVGAMSEMLTNRQTAKEFLSREVFPAAATWQKDLASLLDVGFPLSEPFLYRSIVHLQQLQLVDIRTKSRVLVRKGVSVFGVCDPTPSQDLLEGQVVLKLMRRLPDDQNRWLKTRITGPVVVTRNPCLHPGDIRVLEAVVPENEHLKGLTNVIVFSVRGKRPPADEMSGGDLDGDTFSVFFDGDLLPPTVVEAMNLSPRPSRELPRPVNLQDLIDFFIRMSRNASLGDISVTHRVWADKKGAQSPECVELAELHSIAVDCPNTGIEANMRKDLRQIEFPHYMERRNSYRSSNVLAKMYDEIIGLELKDQPQPESDSSKWLVPPDLLVEGYSIYLEDAMKEYTRYRHEASAMMIKYEVASEAEFFSGAVLQYYKVSSRATDKKFNQQMGTAVDQLKARYRSIFMRGLPNDDEAEECKKACSWLYVAYSDNRPEALRSFPWVVADSIRKLRARTTKDNSLEEVVHVVEESSLRVTKLDTLQRGRETVAGHKRHRNS